MFEHETTRVKLLKIWKMISALMWSNDELIDLPHNRPPARQQTYAQFWARVCHLYQLLSRFYKKLITVNWLSPRGHFNFVCTGVCGHRIGKLTHPQTKAGPSINKNTPILRLFTTEID